MTTVIVNDASCLIDLRKGSLLHVLLRLPYHFVVPLPIRVSELLNFTDQEWRLLDDAGLETFDLPPAMVAEAFQIKSTRPRLSANDCFCLAVTRAYDDAILLTGDRLLRRTAEDDGRRVHGVLWIIDELKENRVCADALLFSALERWSADQAVRLDPIELAKRRQVWTDEILLRVRTENGNAEGSHQV